MITPFSSYGSIITSVNNSHLQSQQSKSSLSSPSDTSINSDSHSDDLSLSTRRQQRRRWRRDVTTATTSCSVITKALVLLLPILLLIIMIFAAIIIASWSSSTTRTESAHDVLALSSSPSNNNNASLSSCEQKQQQLHQQQRGGAKKMNKTIYLLRHAKSSWKDADNINDYDRPLSSKGIQMAHFVGETLHNMMATKKQQQNQEEGKVVVDLPDVILSSSSVRTKATLNIVLEEWMLGGDSSSSSHRCSSHSYRRGKFSKVRKRISQSKGEEDDDHEMLCCWCKILYSKSWYDLSNVGYLNHLVNMLSSDDDEQDNIFSNANTIMIVGHNPSMEKLLNDLTFSSSPLRNNNENAEQQQQQQQQQWQHYSPGHFYVVRFPPTLENWSDLGCYIEKGGRGIIDMHLPE